MTIFLPEVVILFSLDLIVFGLSFLAFLLSINIIKNWDFDSTTTKQYNLEKLVYLAAILIVFTLIIKIVLLPFFLFLLDRLSPLLAGAMCAAGVITANSYGEPLLMIRVLVALLLSLWIVIHHQDLRSKNWQFTKQKFALFVPIFLFISLEFMLEIAYFSQIDTTKAVACCSTLYSTASSAGVLQFDTMYLSVAFGLLGIVTIIASWLRYAAFSLVSSTLFLITALFMITYLISPYIYELPTHQCPYCILQREYHYIGYLLFGSLFAGYFLQVGATISHLWLGVELKRIYKYSAILTAIFLIVSAFYPLFYFIKNGVWL